MGQKLTNWRAVCVPSINKDAYQIMEPLHMNNAPSIAYHRATDNTADEP